MNITLNSLLENYNFNVSNLIPSGKFGEFINKCGLASVFNKELLERLEKQKLFFPIARVLNKPIKYNVEKVDQLSGLGWKDDRGTYWQCMSRHKDNPNWNGVVKTVSSQFMWEKNDVKVFHDEGLIIDPTTARFMPWSQYVDSNDEKRGECFYSHFQILHLKKVLKAIRVEISDATLFGGHFDENIAYLTKDFKRSIKLLKAKATVFHQQTLLLQLLSDRYLPYAQSNQRKMNFSSPHGFELSQVRELWDSKEIIEKNEITQEESKEFHRILKLYSSEYDPIGKWHQLTVFMPWDEKKKVKGDALIAQYLYNHEHMIRMFHKDAFDEQLKAPHYENLTPVEYNHGVTDEKSALPFLEYVVNRYTLNSQPRLVFVVEGESEKAFFPEVISRLWGQEIAETGIHIWNIKGADNFSGSKRKQPYGALERFIDYNHFINGTIVFCLFDKEGGVPRTIQKITSKLSDFRTSEESADKVTYDEYIYIWENDFEADNFTANEIAEALTQQSQNRYRFTDKDVATAQNEHSGSPLSRLYKDKVGKGLNKPALSIQLLDNYITDILPTYDEERDHRPFLTVVDRILNMASWNFEPTCKESKMNNMKFFFSDDEEMKQKRRERFGIEEALPNY
jgi:hypothetical protein